MKTIKLTDVVFPNSGETANIPGNAPKSSLAPLTFTGAVQTAYDGTEPVTVHIPTVQEVIDALPKWTGGAF